MAAGQAFPFLLLELVRTNRMTSTQQQTYWVIMDYSQRSAQYIILCSHKPCNHAFCIKHVFKAIGIANDSQKINK